MNEQTEQDLLLTEEYWRGRWNGLLEANTTHGRVNLPAHIAAAERMYMNAKLELSDYRARRAKKARRTGRGRI